MLFHLFRPTLGAVLIVGFSLQPLLAQMPPPKPETVSFEQLKTMHMAIQIKVNGHGPYRVIFDTGAPVMLLSTKVAKESGLVPKSAQSGILSLFGTMGQVKVKNLEVSGVKVDDVPAVVMDHPSIELMSQVLGPIEGIVGFPFFARFKMTIDYQAKELTFIPNGFDPPDALQNLTRSIMALAEDRPKGKTLAPAAQWGLVIQKEDGDDEPGITVKEVISQSAADEAGLKSGDRILTLDGRWTDSVSDVFLAAEFVKPGNSAPLVIKRGGKDITLIVKPRQGL